VFATSMIRKGPRPSACLMPMPSRNGGGKKTPLTPRYCCAGQAWSICRAFRTAVDHTATMLGVPGGTIARGGRPI